MQWLLIIYIIMWHVHFGENKTQQQVKIGTAELTRQLQGFAL